MGLLIVKDDFIGRFALSKSIEDTIDSYIDEFEEKYLRDMLGVELFKLFKADVSAYLPSSPIYQTIFDPISMDYNHSVIHSRGMKTMLLGFIYWEYIRATKYKHTGTGMIVDVNEVSREADFSEVFLYARYNESINDYKAIQIYIENNLTDYPDYNGQYKRLAWKL